LYYSLIAERGIDHHVVYGTVGPYHVKILFDVSPAFAIDSIHKFQGILLAFAARQQASHFILSGSIEKNSEGIRAVAEKQLRSSSDNDAFSFAGGMQNDALRYFRCPQGSILAHSGFPRNFHARRI
jgi:hypothetical protein